MHSDINKQKPKMPDEIFIKKELTLNNERENFECTPSINNLPFVGEHNKTELNIDQNLEVPVKC